MTSEPHPNSPHENCDQSGDPGHLEWLAFCYVANELEGDALVDFELLLLDDQNARDAVARVVGDCQLIEAACRKPARAPAPGATTEATSSLWRVPAALLAAAAAIFILMTVTQPDTAPTVTTPTETGDTGPVEPDDCDQAAQAAGVKIDFSALEILLKPAQPVTAPVRFGEFDCRVKIVGAGKLLWFKHLLHPLL